MNYTIGITTFSKRKDFLKNLISKIRKFTNEKILVCINGEKLNEFDELYRKDILKFFSEVDGVFPIFFTEIRGLSKMWNTLAIHSDTENILIINDDLDIISENVFEDINKHINSKEYQGFTRINDSFSHFLISKKKLNELGYFDERLLGFGEEDGDIVYRCIKNKMLITSINIFGLINIISNIRQDSIEPGIGKYSKFNRSYIYEKKYQKDISSNIRGMFDSPMKQVIEDTNCYPIESFFEKNKALLFVK